MEYGQLLGGCSLPAGPCAHSHLHHGRPSELDRAGGRNAAVHGNGNLLERKHADHYEPGELGLVEYRGSYHQRKRPRLGDICGHHDNLGNNVVSHRQRGSDGSGRRPGNFHKLSAQWHHQFKLFGDFGSNGRDFALYLVNFEWISSRGSCLESFQWRDHRHSNGRRHLQFDCSSDRSPAILTKREQGAQHHDCGRVVYADDLAGQHAFRGSSTADRTAQWSWE